MTSKEYFCEKCNYSSKIKQNFTKHLLSKKHINLEKTEQEKEECKHICPICNKKYKCYSGLWNHKKKCKDVKEKPENQENQSIALKDFLLEFNELKNMIIELVKKNPTSIITNNNTNNFNISIFLNETCKNAKNMIDFVRDITIELKHLLEIGENGYVNGVSKILTDKLNKCHIHERPMHYYVNDKEDKIHIRDENKWKEDKDEVKQIIDKSINILDMKLDKTHSRYMIDSKMTKEVGSELRKHTGLVRENIEEQEEIINNITPIIKIP